MIVTKTGTDAMSPKDKQYLYDALMYYLKQSYKDKKFFSNVPEDATNRGEWLPEQIEWLESAIMDIRNEWTVIH